MNDRLTHLDTLVLSNFRRFETLTIGFDPTLTVLVADNGGGKSAVLDGVSLALRLLVEKLLGSQGHGFDRSDIRLVSAPTGAMVEMLPTSLDASGVIDGQSTTWRREIAQSKTTVADAKELTRRAEGLLHELSSYANRRSPSPPPLPVIAYYGTGRLWSTHKLTKGKEKAAKDLIGQVKAYQDCLSPSSSFNHFIVWFESVVREAQNELQTGVASPHHPQAMLAAIRGATDIALKPSRWTGLDWDFLLGEVVAVHPEQGRLPVSFLSDGVRNLIALVADLAHRAVRLNPHFGAEACIMSPGVVLIDEVDMHLHPRWQQTVIGLLRTAFPRLQFIATTHSPQVISTVPSACIRIIDEQGRVAPPTVEVQGADAPLALAHVFETDSTPELPITATLSDYLALIEQARGDSEEAHRLRVEVVAHFGDQHPVVLAADAALRFHLKARSARSKA